MSSAPATIGYRTNSTASGLQNAIALHAPGPQAPHWYALHTRARHEKKVAAELVFNGIRTFLPLVKQIHRWADRRKLVELPVFPCYVFAHTVTSPDFRATMSKINGILRLVGDQGCGTPIPDVQLEYVQRLINQDILVSEHPFLKAGQRVRVRGGKLDGLEGILVGKNGAHQLVLSIDAMQRSISIALEGYDLEVA